MAISATDPISYAYDRVVQMLFKPFDASKWFTLAFCAWLATLAEGMGANIRFPGPGGGPPGPGPGGRRPPPQTFPEVLEEMKGLFFQHAWWIVPVLILALALFMALMWVRARGKFMFMEGVAYDRAAVVEPWKRLRPLANSYFRFELVLTSISFVALAVLGTVLFLVALPDIRAQQISVPTIAALVVGGLLLIAGTITFALVFAMTEDFVIPLMYLRGQMIREGWREFRLGILRGNVGSIVVFYLMRIVLGLGAAMIIMLGTCLTCCVAAPRSERTARVFKQDFDITKSARSTSENNYRAGGGVADASEHGDGEQSPAFGSATECESPAGSRSTIVRQEKGNTMLTKKTTTEVEFSSRSNGASRSSSSPATSGQVTQEQIARRAYEIYKSGTGGTPEANWYRAERELRARA